MKVIFIKDLKGQGKVGEEKNISDGNPAIAKNILLRTKNNAKRYAHIGIIGFISNLLDISI